ncbi:MAG: BON domain-containing protein [Pirellulaceae bacterium]
MFGESKLSDKELGKTVGKRLVRAGGGSRTPLVSLVRQGVVTLTGTLRYESQRRPILKAISCIAGVSRIIDQLKVAPKTNY